MIVGADEKSYSVCTIDTHQLPRGQSLRAHCEAMLQPKQRIDGEDLGQIASEPGEHMSTQEDIPFYFAVDAFDGARVRQAHRLPLRRQGGISI